MSQSSRLIDAMTRIGGEIKTVRTLVNAKYTKPGSGIPSSDLTTDIQTSLTAAKRWEQELLVQAETRVLGYGPAPLGLYIPYNIRITGIRYQFETATTAGTTTASLWLNRDYNFDAASAAMSIAANSLVQNISGLAIDVDAGSRLSLNVTSIGVGTVGKGLYMCLYGEYR